MKRSRIVLLAVVAACVAFAMLPTTAFAISRDLVIARGMVWVHHLQKVNKKTGAKTYGVPYSQSRWAYTTGSLVPTSAVTPSTLGYRTDCSGFASMCWGLTDSQGHPYSECTATFGAKGSKKYFAIGKSQLLVGDMLLASAVWGAPSPHAIIFDGWANSAHTQFWALEQTTSSAHDGTILHVRSYPPDAGRYPNGKTYYKPYRYSGLQAPYSDVEQSISSPDQYCAAAAACDAVYPTKDSTTVPALVLASGSSWSDQITAASLAGAVGGPVLLTSPTSLPALTAAEITRLKPKRVFILGSGKVIGMSVSSQIASMGVPVVRISGSDSYRIAVKTLPVTIGQAKANGRPVNTVYLVTGSGVGDALSIAPVLARTGRPVLFVGKDSMRPDVARALKASGVKTLTVVGPTSSVSRLLTAALMKARYHVTRVGSTNPSVVSSKVVNYALSLGVGFQWHALGVTSTSSCMDALAWAWSNGHEGSLYLITPSTSLNATVRGRFRTHRTQIGKARVYGGAASVSDSARKSLAKAMRTGT